MSHALQWICAVIVALWAGQAVLAMLQVYRQTRLFRKKDRPNRESFRPFATVIVPIKGIDRDLAAAVRGLCEQDYPGYRVVIVLESADDPAYPVLKEELAKYPQRESRILFAGVAPPTQGQKVHNQLHALSQLDGEAGDDEASDGEACENVASDDELWVFADSDAIPDAAWLANLAGRHRSEHRIGVTTGYRWIVSADPPPLREGLGEGDSANESSHANASTTHGSSPPPNLPLKGEGPENPPAIKNQKPKTKNSPAFWSHIASIINSSVACAYRSPRNDQAWGGAMAMQVKTARRGELRRRWTGALTDDYPVTRMCRELGLEVKFIPQCLAATPVHFDFASFFSFARRQYLITRVYSPVIYFTALAVLTFWCVGFVTAWAHLLINVTTQPGEGWWRWSATAIGVVFVANQVRATLRRRVIRLALGDATVVRLRRTLMLERWLTPVWMTLHLMVAAAALCGRRFTWRGIRYQLDGPQQVTRLT